MSGRHFYRRPRSLRWVTPTVECLDGRELLSASAVGHSLGPSLVAPTILPRVTTAAVLVDPHNSINTFLSAQLGTGVATIEQHVEADKTSTNTPVTQQVLGNSFVHAVLNRQDTYTLLNSVATTTLGTSAASTAGGTDQGETVTYAVPGQATIPNGLSDPALVSVVPELGGFSRYIPLANITILSTSPFTATANIPRDKIPPGDLLPASPTVPTGSLTNVFTSTGPIILSALRFAIPHPSPNAPPSIPGLRLAPAFAHTNNFPSARTNSLLYAFRVAVDRNVFALSANQTSKLSAGLIQFESTVATMNAAGTFTPSTPLPAPALPRGPLYGTLEVSLGALRKLTNAATGADGLQLPGVGNFPGRLDVGYIFDRFGNFGIILSARGPLSGVPTHVASANLIAGDVRVEVSNAQSLSALDGTSHVEGLTQGTALESGVETGTFSNGVKTFGASAGYGSGLEFGTGTAYTQVIPLGNVYALIPEFPKN